MAVLKLLKILKVLKVMKVLKVLKVLEVLKVLAVLQYYKYYKYVRFIVWSVTNNVKAEDPVGSKNTLMGWFYLLFVCGLLTSQLSVHIVVVTIPPGW